MAEAIDAAAAKLSNTGQHQGFRKGKVPKKTCSWPLGRRPGALRSEAIRDSIPDFYALAISDTLIDPIAQPDINITSGEEEGVLGLRGGCRSATRSLHLRSWRSAGNNSVAGRDRR